MLYVISEGSPAAHPHSFALRGCDFVSNPFTGDLAFELSEGKQNVKSKTSHGCRGVELLRYGYERHPVSVQSFNDLCEISQAARQAIDLVDHNRIGLAIFNIGQQPLKSWPRHASP